MSNTRAQYILQILNVKQVVSLTELASNLSVSVVTIRKDVAELERQGLVHRQHGKVSLPSQAFSNYFPLIQRNQMQEEEKKRIAVAAAKLISPNDTLILDAGTTTASVAQKIASLPPLSIATNSIIAAQLLLDSPHSISIAGGQMINQSLCTIGGDAISFFRSLRASKLFLGATGIQKNLTLTAGIRAEAEIKQEMIKVSKEVILVVDSHKFYNSSMFPFCSAEQIDCIITGARPPEEMEEEILRQNIRLIIAE